MTQSLAQSLWNARVSGEAIPKPEVTLTLEQAYALQRDIFELSGRRHLGWKVGSTSLAAQAKLGTTEPGAAALLEGLFFASGDAIPISTAHHVFVEGEFAFLIGRDMDFKDTPDLAEIADRIDAMIPGIEVVGSRYETGLTGSGRELVTADGGANIAFVGGNEQSGWSVESLPDQSVALLKNDQLVASGRGADALDHPLNVVQWLIGHCAANNRILKAGEVITTGTCTGLIAVAPGDTVRVEFAGLGEVSAHFTEMERVS